MKLVEFKKKSRLILDEFANLEKFYTKWEEEGLQNKFIFSTDSVIVEAQSKSKGEK